MNRGEVWWVDFNPSVGGEIQKQRPAVIVSNDVSNRILNRLQVVPLTTNTRRIYSGETLVTLNGRHNKAMANQLTSVSKLRVLNRAGRISTEDMRKIEQVIMAQLGLAY